MPKAIDENALSNLNQLDIAKPPQKDIPFYEYPKVVYLHPKDKTKEHRSKVVQSAEEEKAAKSQGYRLKPHIPEVTADAADIDLSEYETGK